MSFAFDIDDAPAAAQAAALALAILKRVKCATWDEFTTRCEEGDPGVIAAVGEIELSETQLVLLEQNPYAVSMVSASTPLRKPLVCDTCGEILVTCGSGTPRKCLGTHGCTGTYVGPATVRRHEVTDTDLATAA